MAATVVNTSLSQATWTKAMPKDYKDKFKLGDSLAAFEAMVKKDLTMPANLPVRPDGTVKAIESCVDQMKKDIKSLEDAAKGLKERVAAAEAVGSAASKAADDLRKAAKDKSGGDADKYNDAAGVASGIGATAKAQAKAWQGK
jgi:hypothetical protein